MTVCHAFGSTGAVVPMVIPFVTSLSPDNSVPCLELPLMGLAPPDGMLSQQAALMVVGFADPDHCQALGLAFFAAVPGLAHQQVPVGSG